MRLWQLNIALVALVGVLFCAVAAMPLLGSGSLKDRCKAMRADAQMQSVCREVGI